MPSKEDYLELSEKVSSLKERRAILASNEEKKANERKELLEELVKFGVDPNNPAKETQRLELEIASEYEQAKKAVDQFERDLNAATGQTPHLADEEASEQRATVAGDVIGVESEHGSIPDDVNLD